MKKRVCLTRLFFLAAALVLIFSCARDLGDTKGGDGFPVAPAAPAGPTGPLATILGGGAPDGEVNEANVNALITDMVNVGYLNVEPAQSSCGEVEGSLDNAAICPDGGSVAVENCAIVGDAVSYDIVFTDCTTSAEGIDVTMNGSIEIDAEGDFIDVVYNNFEITAPPAPPTTLNMTVSFYVLSDDSVISFTVNVDQVTVNGVDASDAACTAVVTVDTNAGTWTSDGGCGLPAGPITY